MKREIRYTMGQRLRDRWVDDRIHTVTHGLDDEQGGIQVGRRHAVSHAFHFVAHTPYSLLVVSVFPCMPIFLSLSLCLSPCLSQPLSA